MMVAFKSRKSSWEWYEEPGNEFRMKRFLAAMEGSAKFGPPDAILQGFKWNELPPKSLVVDVGGGIGHTVMVIRKAHSSLKFVVQDRPAVIEQGHSFWKSGLPSALSDGSVILQAHDFMTPQLILQAKVFICRMIIHDYGRSKARTILRNLRDAAAPDTKLLIVDQVVPYACVRQGEAPIGHDIPASAIAYIGDFQMFVAAAGEERTLDTFIELLRSSGWKITEIFTIPGSLHKQILAVPV